MMTLNANPSPLCCAIHGGPQGLLPSPWKLWKQDELIFVGGGWERLMHTAPWWGQYAWALRCLISVTNARGNSSEEEGWCSFRRISLWLAGSQWGRTTRQKHEVEESCSLHGSRKEVREMGKEEKQGCNKMWLSNTYPQWPTSFNRAPPHSAQHSPTIPPSDECTTELLHP